MIRLFVKHIGKSARIRVFLINTNRYSNPLWTIVSIVVYMYLFFSILKVAEVFTGTPGKLVPLKETIKGFKMVLNGKETLFFVLVY
jgi:F0F1-type ATP synthase beta subunit